MSLKNTFLTIIVILTFIGVSMGLYYMAFYESTDYYSVIDNSKYKFDKANKDYKYILDSYDDNGKLKEISFNVNRELREGAYIKLKYMKLRGVVSWEEVILEEIPSKARKNLE